MEIKKINDRQICCIISPADLIKSQIRLSELAFGSNKAKMFFRELMQKAKDTCGFDAVNAPLMIEASPEPPDSIKLIITKMNPGETHVQKEDQAQNNFEIHFEGADNVLNMIRQMRAEKAPAVNSPAQTAKKDDSSFSDKTVVEAFRFQDMESVILAAAALKDIYDGENSLYSETGADTYLLTARCVYETPEEFNKICNILTEYSVPVHCSKSGEFYMKEHGNEMIADRALQILAGF